MTDGVSLAGGRFNAIAGWILVGVLILVAAGSSGSGALLDGGFSLLLVAVATSPAVRTRDWRAMAPWPLLFGATLAVVARWLGAAPELAGFVAISMLALLVVVELDTFTPVDLGRRFAAGFAVMTTLAIEALWIVAQFYSDSWLGTEFLTTQTELQWDIVLVTVVGFAAGGLYYALLTLAEAAGATSRRSGVVDGQ